MDHNINQLDEIEAGGSEVTADQFDEYQSHIVQAFLDSIDPDGADSYSGFWASQLIHFGYNYVGTSLVRMQVIEVEEILTDLFPRKITLQTPSDAGDIIPELIAFWQFLEKTYHIKNSILILRYLHKIKPDFNGIMNDTSRFGMAKSMMTAGRKAGYDMTSSDDINEFIGVYNQSILDKQNNVFSDKKNIAAKSDSRKIKLKKKNIRKLGKLSRKKNRKKR